jgi:hypothetical protein
MLAGCGLIWDLKTVPMNVRESRRVDEQAAR